MRPQEELLKTQAAALKHEMRRKNDRELNLAILAMEAEVTKDKEECERAAENRYRTGAEPLERRRFVYFVW